MSIPAQQESIAVILQERGVTSDITAIPSGIDRQRFACGSGSRGPAVNTISQTVLSWWGMLAGWLPKKSPVSDPCRLRLPSIATGGTLLACGNGTVVGGDPTNRKTTGGRESTKTTRLVPKRARSGRRISRNERFRIRITQRNTGYGAGRGDGGRRTGGRGRCTGSAEVVRDSFNGRLLAKDDHQEIADAISGGAERSPTQQDAR